MEIDVNVDLKEIEKKLNKLANWGKIDVKNLRDANRKAAQIYVRAARKNIVDAKVEAKIYRNGKLRATIEPGRLRRSVGTWVASPKGNAIIAGPKKSSTGRARPNAKNDGWHQVFVEKGHVFGNKTSNTRNKGVFERTKGQVNGRIKSMQVQLYRERFGKYVRGL